MAAPPVARHNATTGSTFSILGDGITVTGNIDAKVDLHIDGTVTGDVKCVALVQGPTSVIKGAIVADSASLSGTVEGSIDARDLVISRSAKIMGDVAYENLQIEQGGHVDGKFKHKSAAGPNIRKTTVDVGTMAPPLELTSSSKVA
ncbi:MAG: polymer-forming cytoskeletal protein [Parasphingorhabdus sp.]|nr:polymer-forming cytoskeletal protein [Parasphingorhabdus sp.]